MNSSQNSELLCFQLLYVSFPSTSPLSLHLEGTLRPRGMRAQVPATHMLVSCACASSFARTVCGIASAYLLHASKPLQRQPSKSASLGRLSFASLPCAFVYLPYTSKPLQRKLSRAASLLCFLVASFFCGVTFVFLLGTRKPWQTQL